ncbi:sigma-70 family RNA polymerase sigma factor [Mesobacterium pallidum]|uniref:sigma-70 family RNA polymerase sigma factor n=1 Tax=Mesobacterium pallidum TaxID=2872037 RepID=UPI001EE33B2C|nr:sigma-70 family RNA polymerase sigma factor [Mesobacterium pallidum]
MATLEEIEDWIARCALGDRAAFSSLYDATSAKLFGVCLRVLKHRGEAEECLQDVYIRIWRKADRYAVTGHSPMTWLITVARNLAIDRLRARRPDAGAEDIADRRDLSAPGPSPEAAVIAGSEARRIAGCMNELDEDRADAVKGAYLDGDTYQELAERHGVPLNTMRTWLRRSLQKLRECLDR